MLLLIIKISVLTSIWILGIKVATKPGMILEKLGEYCKDKVDNGSRFFEPTCVCAWCMPSLHSIIGFVFAYIFDILPLNVNVILLYPFVVMLSSFVCGVLWTLCEILITYSELVNHKETLAHYDIKDRKAKYNLSLKSNSYAYGKKNILQSER
jgi:hypothetical protein